MNRTDLLGAAAVYEAAQGLVPCHRFTDRQTYTPVVVAPEQVPHRDADGVTVQTE